MMTSVGPSQGTWEPSASTQVRQAALLCGWMPRSSFPALARGQWRWVPAGPLLLRWSSRQHPGMRLQGLAAVLHCVVHLRIPSTPVGHSGTDCRWAAGWPAWLSTLLPVHYESHKVKQASHTALQGNQIVITAQNSWAAQAPAGELVVALLPLRIAPAPAPAPVHTAAAAPAPSLRAPAPAPSFLSAPAPGPGKLLMAPAPAPAPMRLPSAGETVVMRQPQPDKQLPSSIRPRRTQRPPALQPMYAAAGHLFPGPFWSIPAFAQHNPAVPVASGPCQLPHHSSALPTATSGCCVHHAVITYRS